MIKTGLLFNILLLLLTFSVNSYAQKKPRLVDPTRPVSLGSFSYVPELYRRDRDSEYQLQKILISKQRRLAMIDDRLVAVGDNIGEFKVVSIDHDVVTLASEEIKLELTLFEYPFDKNRSE